jgi:hypothetical protein
MGGAGWLTENPSNQSMERQVWHDWRDGRACVRQTQRTTKGKSDVVAGLCVTPEGLLFQSVFGRGHASTTANWSVPCHAEAGSRIEGRFDGALALGR